MNVDGDLLRREQEFYKINSELEERTHRILQGIDSEKNNKNVNNQRGVPEKRVSRPKAYALRDGFGKVSSNAGEGANNRELDDELLYTRNNGIGYEATNRLLRAKLTILNKETETLRQDYKTKVEEYRRSNAELTRSEEERGRLESALNVAKDAGTNLQTKLEVAQQSVTRLQAENLGMSKELNQLKKELKQQRQQASIAEMRLNRAVEDAEKFKTSAKQSQMQDKEAREQQRHIIDQLQTTIKTLERQRTELMSVCTKQLHLIDNLRRQKAHMEVTRMASKAEKEFDSLLDWCLRNEGHSTKS